MHCLQTSGKTVFYRKISGLRHRVANSANLLDCLIRRKTVHFAVRIMGLSMSDDGHFILFSGAGSHAGTQMETDGQQTGRNIRWQIIVGIKNIEKVLQ